MAVTEQRTPSLIASEVDVVYRVFGAKRVGTIAGTNPRGGRVGRLLWRGSGSVGAIREVHAVKGVSFVAHHGESIGIIGRNGSGKSTLLRALAGLVPATSGSVYLRGTASLLGVNAVLMRELSGERNVMIGGQALGLTPAQVRERLDDIVEFAGLEDFIDLPMKAYSSGMAARLRFAISTAAVPDILMVDEALATGDSDFKERSSARIAEIRENAGTVFLVSHSDAAIRSICDRALWLERGELVMDGPVGEVCDAYQAARVRRAAKKRTAARTPVSRKPEPKRTAPETPAPTEPAEGSAASEAPAATPSDTSAPEDVRIVVSGDETLSPVESVPPEARPASGPGNVSPESKVPEQKQPPAGES